MSRPTVRLLAALLAVLLLATGCSGIGAASGRSKSSPPSSPSVSPSSSAVSTVPPSTVSPGGGSRYGRYVALGDSYSAGPLVPITDVAGGCFRSDHNYPSLVARALGVRTFVDVTCSGATTADLTGSQAGFGGATVPPQLAALNRGTDLVTLGIGGNDLDLFSTVISTCTGLRAKDPAGSPCARRLAAQGPDLQAATTTIAVNVTSALREVRRRAPRATVVLVGYLRLAPQRGTCRALPLARGDYRLGRQVSQSLDRALRRAAHRTGTRYVDMYAASRGHDICSARPWVNGKETVQGRALAYHPLAAGMRADAARVLAALRR